MSEAQAVQVEKGEAVARSKRNWDTPPRAVRRYCLDCMCNSRKEVRLCPTTHCPLYRFRLGSGAKEEKQADS
ncbi:hypothetical protein NLA06_12625 [Desulfomicrobium sp. ZS1]|uniref:hypothetical protein n=1 Tax=Desulfomicrobium sp. ZS1 TaxID=2952228 RepID=UPI0020B30DE7|nr:hypothetical protein [Desulfomicrobium sp. ZS1]UTF49401.1 hypothetical protein NLA06_12625 [Desulfomicrobium sp. ZS1]